MAGDFGKREIGLAADVLGAAASEGNVEVSVAALVKALGSADLQARRWAAGVQPDIRCPTERVVIETKRPGGAVDPRRPGTGSGGGESAFEQVGRYVGALYGGERAEAGGGSGVPWIGVVTDGAHWHAWLWPAHGGVAEEYLPSRCLRVGSELELLAWLHRVLWRGAGRPAVPDDPYSAVFEPYLARLREMHNLSYQEAGAAAARARRTQMRLWYDMLRGSGMVPDEEDSAELFVRHTFLVVVARAVVWALSGAAAGGPGAGSAPGVAGSVSGQSSRRSGAGAAAGAVGDGFVSWVLKMPRGADWAGEVFAAADSFDWRARPRDVLRAMYEAVISRGHRKSFGEYYTPDWLAEMVVERVCDEVWCERSVLAAVQIAPQMEGIGVLDPACGSGTFLFHAARRVCESAGAQGWTAQQQADIAARLVWGIDIHPVAVEIARATLLRALPAMPSEGLDGLRVHQGDSLSTPAGDDRGGLQQASGIFTFVTPGGRRIDMPIEFARQPRLAQRIRQLVDSCAERRSVPGHLLSGLSGSASSGLRDAHRSLTEAIGAEGNGVWAWYFRNRLSTKMLEERRVDRIVANPPWVRMSEIQVEDRREAFHDMIVDAGLYASARSRSATGVAGGFDIAALFVARCEDLFLVGEGGAAGWVLNRASLTADNWAAFRGRRPGARAVSLEGVRPQPFSGAHSAVWFTGVASDGERVVLSVREGERMRRGDRWSSVRHVLEEAAASPPRFEASPSAYVAAGSAMPPRSGANLRPHCLVLVDDRHKRAITGSSSSYAGAAGSVGVDGTSSASGHAGATGSVGVDDRHERSVAGSRFWIATVRSRQRPWRQVEPLGGEAPKAWLAEAVLSKNLLVGCFSADLRTCVVPVDDRGALLSSEEALAAEQFWRDANAQYENFRGRGETTPDNLIQYLDYLGQLSAQLEARERWTVIYNKSGGSLRAARSDKRFLVNDACYWLRTDDQREAAYLVAILNCDALQEAFQAARKSDRDYVTHFWHSVPIPKHDRSDRLHRELAGLGAELERAASEVRDSAELAGAGQVKVSRVIREALRDRGVAGRIDGAVRQLLPDHASPNAP